MPTLNWIGKEAVVNHHLTVPFRLLKDVPELSCGDPGSGNLIVEGDNLVALKALLPYYAGQVKCIYIDPPYNTGNEGWAYNDNVNSPLIREWIGKAVGKEGETLDRHDRWLCMMYPRLALLKEFLREDGSIWISLDDNEIQALRYLMDEIFGADNFVTTVIWEKRTTRENRRVFSFAHDYILCFARNRPSFESVRGALPLNDDVKNRYKNPDNDPRGSWQSVSLNAQAGHGTPSQFYTLVSPNGNRFDPPAGRCWSVTEKRYLELVADNRIYFGKTGTNAPRMKKFLSEVEKGLTPSTIWRADEVGTTDSASKGLLNLFGGDPGFNTTPKPPELLHRIFQIAVKPGELVLDSFAGSGTTGQALLEWNEQNKSPDSESESNFILIEMESTIAQTVTAKRVKLSKERLERNGKNNDLRSGGFRYCQLGEPLFDETGEIRKSVSFTDLARHVWFTETGEPLPKERVRRNPFLGDYRGTGIYLLYNGILADKSPEGGNVLTRSILADLPPFDGPRVVYCAGCRIGADRLRREGITIRQTPYEIKVS